MRDLIEWRVSQALAASAVLQDAVIAESGLMEILTLAAAEDDQANRWARYEELKSAGAGYVGWKAGQDRLASTSAYEAFIEALDSLLPAPVEDIA